MNSLLEGEMVVEVGVVGVGWSRDLYRHKKRRLEAVPREEWAKHQANQRADRLAGTEEMRKKGKVFYPLFQKP